MRVSTRPNIPLQADSNQQDELSTGSELTRGEVLPAERLPALLHTPDPETWIRHHYWIQPSIQKSLLAGEPLPGRLLRDAKCVADLCPATASPPSLGHRLADQLVDGRRRVASDG